MSTVRTALADGITATRASFRAVLVAWVASLLVALPLGAALFVALADDLGHELAAENLRVGWDDRWHRAFAAQADGLEATFDAGVTGVGALLRALDAQIAGSLFELPAPILAAALCYALVWVFLAGGFVTRFVHGDEAGRGFWAGAAKSFRPLFVLALVMGAGYWAVLGPLRDALGEIVTTATRDTVDERIHALWVLAKIVVVWGMVWTIGLVHDYARIGRVADPSRPLPAVLSDAARFVLAHARTVYGLSLAVFAIGAGLLGAWSLFAPGAKQSNPFLILVAFALSQLSVLARIGVRVLGWASQAAFVRNRAASRG